MVKGPWALKGRRGTRRSFRSDKKQYLVTLAHVSSRRNNRSRAQTTFTIDNQHFLVQVTPQTSWPPDVPAESLEARSPRPGVFSQASSAGILSKIPQPGVLRSPQQGFRSQESSTRIPRPGILSQESSARSPQPGVLSQESSARSPQQGFLSQESPVNLFGVRAGVICHVTLIDVLSRIGWQLLEI